MVARLSSYNVGGYCAFFFGLCRLQVSAKCMYTPNTTEYCSTVQARPTKEHCGRNNIPTCPPYTYLKFILFLFPSSQAHTPHDSSCLNFFTRYFQCAANLYFLFECSFCWVGGSGYGLECELWRVILVLYSCQLSLIDFQLSSGISCKLALARYLL